MNHTVLGFRFHERVQKAFFLIVKASCFEGLVVDAEHVTSTQLPLLKLKLDIRRAICSCQLEVSHQSMVWVPIEVSHCSSSLHQECCACHSDSALVHPNHKHGQLCQRQQTYSRLFFTIFFSHFSQNVQ